MKLKPQSTAIVDGENNPISVDFVYAIKGRELQATLAAIHAQHGPQAVLLPLSGQSAGAGVFQIPAMQNRPIIGLQFLPPTQPKLSTQSDVDIQQLGLDEIVIDAQHARVHAGAAVSLQQLNTALQETLGPQYKVLGADLTSYTYAQVGATFMTGGMGPQRRFFSDSVAAISLYDGEGLVTISGDALGAYAGTYGWTGMVTAVSCDFHQIPRNELAFALPVNSDVRSMARLLGHFAPFCYLNCDDAKLSAKGSDSVIFGIEHITRDSMQPLMQSATGSQAVNAARTLASNCELAQADGMVFINGFSDLEPDEFLAELLDDPEAQAPSIAGIDLEHTQLFSHPDEMRDIREAVSYAARVQEPKGAFSYKGHTDLNIRLNPDCVEDCAQQMWRAYQAYVSAVSQLFAAEPQLQGQILVYGHLNPFGLDPHNRITFATENETVYEQSLRALDALKNHLMAELADLCLATGSLFIGGEKAAGSDAELFAAFGDLNAFPQVLSEKLQRQISCIANSAEQFSWRALPPYQA